jgi:orotidine-5'-phosphate decarboxylase
MNDKTELVIALDFESIEAAEKIVTALEGLPVIYKIGLELFTATGSAWVKHLTSTGHRVFLDLKLYDIPTTVCKTILQIAKMNVEFTTVHLSGGHKMLDLIEKELPTDCKLKILGVSVLTSFHEEDWISNTSLVAKLGAARSIHDSVLHFSTVAHDHPAVSGLVCSPHEIEEVRKKYPELYLMIPGIRPKDFSKTDDQARVMTPQDASRIGANAIVVGRPITQAENPRLIAEQILKDLS